MPSLSTGATVGLQILIVGLGSSIGREAAPRLLGGLAGDHLADLFRTDARMRRILIAAGAGAGLAAVYDVPLGGALFAVEVILGEASLLAVLSALVAAVVATLVARFVVPAGPLYQVPSFHPTPSLLVLAAVLGVVLGAAGLGFERLAARARRVRPTGWRILLVMPSLFLGVGLLAIPFPELLGNGRALTQRVLEFQDPIAVLLALAALKALATVVTVGSGAEGGLLTPSVSIGAALGSVAAALWATVWTGSTLAGGAVLGGAAFLAATTRAPITAAVLAFEFTGAGSADLLVILLAVGTATAARETLAKLAHGGRPDASNATHALEEEQGSRPEASAASRGR